MASAQTLMGLGMPAELAVASSDGVNTAVVNGTAQGVRTFQSVNNVTDALPTQAEMVTAFGAAATRAAGWVGFIKDNDADTNFFICASNGTSYYALKLTKGS
jgi:hypothetical protein